MHIIVVQIQVLISIDVLIYKHKTSQETSYIFLTFELY